jgi:hypothetical protein
MKTISRNQIVAEELIREHVRKRIFQKMEEQTVFEQKLRSAVRRLIEAEAGTEEPSTYTGINVLANLLEKIVPILEDAYKMLTTSPEQRESFRNHIVHAIKNSLSPIEVATGAEKLPEGYVFTVFPGALREDLKIDLDPQTDGEEDASVQGEFIDIEDADEDDQFVELDDQNETGRNFAASTYKNVEKQIVDAYDMLADEEDQKLFYDYLITNMLLYFDKFEDELSNSLPDMTTPEYEEETADAGNEEELDMGSEEELEI